MVQPPKSPAKAKQAFSHDPLVESDYPGLYWHTNSQGLKELVDENREVDRYQSLVRGRVLYFEWADDRGRVAAMKMRVLAAPRGTICDHLIPNNFMVSEVLEIRQSAAVSKKFAFVGLASKTFSNHFDGSDAVGGKLFVQRVCLNDLQKALFPSKGKKPKRLIQYFDCKEYLEELQDCDFGAKCPTWWDRVGVHPDLEGIAGDEPLSDNGQNPAEDEEADDVGEGAEGGTEIENKVEEVEQEEEDEEAEAEK